MTTIHFDGVDDQLNTVSTKALNGPLTMAAIFRRRILNNSAGEALISPRDSNTVFFIDSSNKIAYYNGGSSVGPLVNDTTNWYIGVVSFTAVSGLWTPRFHLKNLTADTPWTHVDGSAQRSGIPNTSLGQAVRVGRCNGVTLNTNADIGLVSWWEANLTDPQVEALSANKRTSDWNNVLAPAVLSELNTITPVDLKGIATWTVAGNPAFDGPNPTGWTFDGLGPVPIPNIQMFTKAGWVSLDGLSTQDEGSDLTLRTKLNFVGAGVTATDDSANARTLITIPGGYSRTTKTHTTASLAAGASEDSLLTVFPGWRAFKVATSRPARIRIYDSAAHRTADASRAVDTTPTGDHGRLFEIVTSIGFLSYVLSPVVDFASSAANSSDFYVAVTNLDTTTGTVVTTYDYVRTE